MTRSYSLRRLPATLLLASLAAVTPAAAQTAAQRPNRQVTNVLLIHGAWADGSSWSKVIPLLEDRGLNVVAVQLPLTSLAEDVATVERALALIEGRVLMVAHSYGGVVMTQAGNDPRVAGLVYVAAFAPSEGQSAFDLATANPTPILDELRPDALGFLKITPAGVRRDFAQDLHEAEQTVLIATQSPTAGGASLSTPVSTAAWRNKPTWFVIASRDRVVAPALQNAQAKQMNATAIRLAGSHVVMLSQPYAVASAIRKAARDLR